MVNSTFLMKGTGYYHGDVVVISPVYQGSILLNIEEPPPHSPNGFRLFQNYPNPFNPATTIPYQLATAGLVEITIYNSLGQKVETVLQEKQTAGQHSAQWNASGRTSGIYFYTLKTADIYEIKKMILLQ